MESKLAPILLAGPALRRLEPKRLVLWLALADRYRIRLELYKGDQKESELHELLPDSDHLSIQGAARHLYYHLIDLKLEVALPHDHLIGYQLWLCKVNENSHGKDWFKLTDIAPHLLHESRDKLFFKLPQQVHSLLHGSCRNPHFDGSDGLVEADYVVSSALFNKQLHGEALACPSMLVLTGDQIYSDDVSGPMLHAIHQVIDALQFPEEVLADRSVPEVNTSDDLYNHGHTYYHREQILPQNESGDSTMSLFFSSTRKPIFTTVNAQNHLISLAEYLSMYLLVWSPTLWSLVDLTPPEHLNEEDRQRYLAEKTVILQFISGLEKVQRLFAHIPVAMIFDDHDLSDDWNLNRTWEMSAYGHPFSRQIIANGLIAYLVNQGWGNNPDVFKPMLEELQQTLTAPGGETSHKLSLDLLRFEQWQYCWDTQPKLVVIDTRTRRWRSETSPNRPSGLLDWEAITELQSAVYGLPAVILVSPAPVFGVKLIEVIQKFFTLIGYPLVVDAENWMAHPGSANGILNVFRHRKTPSIFTVLSGDVHYSFAYDIRWRRDHEGPEIYQICSSGLRNSFPNRLLALFDQLNRLLFAPHSPLNWLTRRRSLRIFPRKPQGTAHGRRLLNGTGVGLVEFSEDGRPTRIRQLLGGNEYVDFKARLEAENRYH